MKYEYSGDEWDRCIRRIGRQISLKFKRATFDQLFNVTLTMGLVVIGLIGAVIYYGQLQEMKKSTELTRIAAENSVTAMRLDQRAWVSVVDVLPEPKNGTLNVRLDFLNTGKTPARNFTVKASGELELNARKTKEITLPGRGVVAPGGRFHSVFSSTAYDPSTATLTIHGRVEYDSVFGSSHWSSFCYYSVRNSTASTKVGFVPCETGNDIDDNPA